MTIAHRSRAAVLAALFLAGCRSLAPEAARLHPLDPLDAGELEAAREALRSDGRLTDGRTLVTLALEEPDKEALAAAERPIPRVAAAVLYDPSTNETFEARVDVAGKRVLAWRPVPGAQPLMHARDYELAVRLARADPRFRSALRRRGITDPDAVYLDPWAPGETPVKGAGAARVVRLLCFHKGRQQNDYGPPIEGVVASVDVTGRGRVLEVTDREPVPLSRTNTDFLDPAVRGPERPAPSISVRGHEVRWDRWRLRYSMHPREGLVLHTVGYEDGGRVRPILHRASISEMWVPYGDPEDLWAWRAAFDEGEYGLGELATPLFPGREVPADAVVPEPTVALYERDGGLLWGHGGPNAIARRARQLVVAFLATIGNYDYFFQWVFAEDGRIAFEVDLTGILLTKGVTAVQCQACDAPLEGSLGSREERTGTLVADHVLAPSHQHFISLRLDLDVDGPKNSVRELNVLPAPAGPENAPRSGFGARATPLRRESEARREASLAEHRAWEVYNPSVRTALGHRPGYLLVPRGNASPRLSAGASLSPLAGFAGHHFWVTRQRDSERYAAGEYPGQGGAFGGLPQWAADDEAIENEDVVVWYTLGVTHVPRPEDYPVMPAARAGFDLVPHGFFTRNPALDVRAARD